MTSLRSTTKAFAIVFMGFFVFSSVYLLTPKVFAQGFTATVEQIGPLLLAAEATAEADILTAGSTGQLELKELGLAGLSLDAIAWNVAKLAVQSMTRSIVNWINSGFEGSPAFVQDLDQHLLQISDAAAGQFIAQLVQTDAICAPFRLKVAATIQAEYYKSTSGGLFLNNQCTLTGIIKNVDQFLAGDFSQGGWRGWFELTLKPQNNPYGAALEARSELAARITNAQGRDILTLNWGDGFMSWRNCKTRATAASGSAGLDSGAVGAGQTAGAQVGDCIEYGPIQTPGKVIESQLEGALGSSLQQLNLADEFDEIISALVQQLLTQVLGGGGLFGLSGSPTSGGSSFINQVGGTPLSSSLSTQSLVSTITGVETSVKGYQSAWQTIANAANQASFALQSLMSCAGSGDQKYTDANSTLTTVVTPIIVQAVNAAQKSQTALANISAVKAEASGAQSTEALSQASAHFQTLQTSGVIPTSIEISYALSQSSLASGSLVTKMNEITADAQSKTTNCTP